SGGPDEVRDLPGQRRSVSLALDRIRRATDGHVQGRLPVPQGRAARRHRAPSVDPHRPNHRRCCSGQELDVSDGPPDDKQPEAVPMPGAVTEVPRARIHTYPTVRLDPRDLKPTWPIVFASLEQISDWAVLAFRLGT